MRLSETNVLGLPVGSTFEGQDVFFLAFEDWTGSSGLVVLKRQFRTTLCHVITQKTEEFSTTAGEACDLAYIK
jgi:hypothetical protein